MGSVERPTRELTIGRADRDRARDLGLDHDGARPKTGKSTDSVARTHHRGIAARSAKPQERDRFLASVDALRDWLNYIGRDATWRVALASLSGCISTQVPLPNDAVFARTLLFVSAVTLGALMGRRLDRKKRRKR